MSKLSLFDNIRNYIRGKSASRMDEWSYMPQFDKDAVEKAFNDLDNSLVDIKPQMRVNGDAMEKILKSGKFKNQFQTHTSGGMLDNDIRAEHTNVHFGTPIDEKSLKNSEKYGYIKSNPGSSGYALNAYGRYNVNFKPSVKDRMTLHLGDSLGSRTGSFIPGDRSTYGVILEEPSASARVNDNYMMNLKDGIPLADRGSYLEAQYHGPLTTGDIESIKADRSIASEKVKKWSTNNYVPLYDENGCYNACFDVAGNRIME